MNMTEFYAKYNLNKYDFAEIAGVGTKSLIKYANGGIFRRKDTKEKIEKAIRVIQKHDLVRPKWDGPYFDTWACMRHNKEVREYMETCKSFIDREP